MPSLPIMEPTEDESVGAQLRQYIRTKESEIGADRVGPLAYVALCVLAVAAILNPMPALAVAGVISAIVLATSMVQRRK